MSKSTFMLGVIAGLIAPGEMGKEPVAWLYNGVRLPKIPEFEGYEYMAITSYTLLNTTYYNLYLCQSMYAGYHTTGDGDWHLLAEGVLRTGAITAGATEWPTPEATGSNIVDIGEYGSDVIVWCNHSFNGPNGEEWINASEPVPVYE